jgi:hypothetical protein
VRWGKIKYEAVEGVTCAVALLLFVFCEETAKMACPKIVYTFILSGQVNVSIVAIGLPITSF